MVVFLQGEQLIALAGFTPTGIIPFRGTLTVNDRCRANVGKHDHPI